MRKIASVVLALVLAMSALVLATACGNDAKKSPVAKPSGVITTAAVVRVGQPLALGGVLYTVTDVHLEHSVSNPYVKEKADGVFVVVDFTVKNEKDVYAPIAEGGIRLEGGNGLPYIVDIDTLGIFGNELTIDERIEPRSSKQIVAVYDLPKKALKGAKVVVTDYWTEATGKINLGL